MDTLAIIMLVFSISLSAGRNILSKGMSRYKFASAEFFLLQGIMFSVGACLLLPLSISEGLFKTSAQTVLYSLIYAALLVSAQWNYTVALRRGKTGICATVYSLGFIFPTLSGVIFWNETLNAFNVIGIFTVALAVVASGVGKTEKSGSQGGGIINLVLAMLSSGGLGIMQKIQQKSAYPNEKGSFVFIAFLAVSVLSLSIYLITEIKNRRTLKESEASLTETEGKPDTDKGKMKNIIGAAGAGLCFGGANFLNTALAGAMDSALFFPLQNISSILLSLALGIIVFNEKIRKKDIITVSLGVISVILLIL